MAGIGPQEFLNDPLDALITMSNDALPPPRHAEVETHLAQALQDLSKLDNEIARLKSTLASLKAQRPLDLVKIELYRSAIAPQRRIPPELLSEIFLKCNREQIILPVQPTKMPWVLARVCSKWRRVSIATPGLWSNVCINLMGEENTERQRNAVQSVLERSHPKFLTLKIASKLPSIPDLIIPHMSRIQCLSLIGNPTHLAPLLSLSPRSFVSLRTLSIHVHGEGEERLSEPIMIAHGVMKLRKMTWRASYFHPGLLKFEYRHLTHLDFTECHGYFHPNAALVVLRQCASLVECCLSIHGLEWDDSQSQAVGEFLASDLDPGNIICVPKLEVLTVSYMSMELDHDFLPRLELPKLRRFKAVTNNDMTWDPASTRTITTSGCLEYFHIDLEVKSADLGHLLERAPNLVELSIGWGEPIPGDTLKLIGRGIVLPRLKIVACVLFDDEDTLAKHLDMIEERRAAAVTPAVTDFANVNLNIVSYSMPSKKAYNLLERAENLCDMRRSVCAMHVELERLEW
ncbi:hypothetical protein Hypma_006419 [Hypsizygus marmoreus]|uniref:Uncharacterized protein n=1 Tax=Hypsizygus marmoreus TaxID=39966 RepID=A0A369K4H3_HYPMA|nr:hypothetical protein Hypma_006419 [Hypsizygus marmoreus]